jgi:hypothetical protein
VYVELSHLLVTVKRLLTIALAVGLETFGVQFATLDSLIDDDSIDEPDAGDGVLLCRRVCRHVSADWHALFASNSNQAVEVASYTDSTTSSMYTALCNNDDNDNDDDDDDDDNGSYPLSFTLLFLLKQQEYPGK